MKTLGAIGTVWIIDIGRVLGLSTQVEQTLRTEAAARR